MKNGILNPFSAHFLKQSLKVAMSIVLTYYFITSQAFAAPKALVYKGPGACEDGCYQAAFELARHAGFDPVYVGPTDLNANSTENDERALFDNARVWIQPGGYASVAMANMTSQLKNAIRNFIFNGGGYVGFCAGAFVATTKVGTTKNSGLGIFPGGTKLYGKGIDIKRVKWKGSERYIYWEGGPYLRNLPKNVETVAHYSNGAVATARTQYGKGKVYITGLHPEAPQDWIDYSGQSDIDGNDFDLGAEMLHWVTQ